MSEGNLEKLSKLKKSLFKVFIHLNSSSAPYQRQFSSFKLLCLAIEQVNTISILIYAVNTLKGFSLESYLVKLFSFSRLDILVSTFTTHSSFALFFISAVISNLLLKLVLIFEVFYGKNFIKNTFVVLVKLTNYLIFSALKIPVLNFTIEVFFTIFQTHEMPEYGGELLKGQHEFRIVVGCFGILFIGMLAMEIILGNIPLYKNNSLSRVCSLVHFKELFVVILIICCKIIVNSELFIIITIGLSCYQGYLYYTFLPFYNNFLNLALIQTWTSLIALGILEFVSVLYQNYYIVELVYPFVFVSLIVLNTEALKRKIEKLKRIENFDDPYTSEQNLRFKLYDEPENSEEIIKEHYKKSTKRFFMFKLQYIWESLTINKYTKDKCLALMKLSKVNLSQYSQSQILNKMNASEDFEYSINLELEFLTYYFFNKLLIKIPDMSNDIILISYSKNLSMFNDTEKKLLGKLNKFSYSVYEQNSSKSLNKRINILGHYIRNYFKRSKKMIKKFGYAKKFIKQHKSFCKNILKVNFVKEKKNKRYSGGVCEQFSKIDKIGAFIIVSGNLNDFGKIFFANESACELIKVGSVSEFVGKKFEKFMPKPFDVISNTKLMKYIMYGETTTSEMKGQFIIDSFGCWVETSISLRLSFFEGKTYFILNFSDILPMQQFIISTIKGNVVGISSKFQNFINSQPEDLILAFPNIKKYLELYSENIIFCYDEIGIQLFIRYKIIRIGANDLIIIYVINEHSQKVLGLEYQAYKKDYKNFHVEMSSVKLNVEANSMFSDNSDKLEKNKAWKKYLKASSRLRKLLKYFFFAQILIMIGLFIGISKVIGMLKFNFIIFDTGLMRYLSTSTLSNIYSLDLLHQNYPVAFSEDFYRAGINENMNRLQFLLNKYNEVTIPVTGELKEYFKDKKLSVYYEKIDSTYEETEYLVNVINTFISDSKKIANTSLESFSSINEKKIFLYKNIPNYYIDALNTTIFSIMNDLIHSLHSIFIYQEGFELILVIVPALLLILASCTLIQIEYGNQLLWEKFNNITSVSLNTYTRNISQRLKNFHFIHEEIEKFPFKKLKKNRTFIVLIPFCKIFLFLLISVGFYLAINLYNHVLLNEVIKQDLVHMNFGGLRRMLTPLTLFWARNSAYESINKKGYRDWFQHSLVGYSDRKLESLIESFEETQQLLMNSLNKYPLNQFRFEKYLQLMYGNSCEYITTVNNCSATYVSHGLDLALQFYIHELRSFSSFRDENKTLSQMINIEKYSKTIEKSFVAGLLIYANYTDEVIIEIKNNLQLTLIYYCLATMIYFLIILRALSDKLNISVENKVFVASLFN